LFCHFYGSKTGSGSVPSIAVSLRIVLSVVVESWYLTRPIPKMDALTAINLALKTGEQGYKAWNWWQKRLGGFVLITHPHSGAMVAKGPVEIEGSHKNARGHFWLTTFTKDQYWPQSELDLRSDGN
jgi:hypothetical protein